MRAASAERGLSACSQHSKTLVTVNGRTISVDISNAQIVIPLNEENRNSVLTVQLEHEEPGLEGRGIADADMDEVGIAFQLQYISYDFIWNDSPALYV